MADPFKLNRSGGGCGVGSKGRPKPAAANFAAVCVRGDTDGLYNASLWLDECVDAWRLAMMKVAKLERVTSEIQEAFVPV
jgi:hypothetical protein